MNWNSIRTLSQWMTFVRQVLEEWAMRSSEQIGEGQVVEIDESKFGKRKYNKGHHVEGQWIRKINRKSLSGSSREKRPRNITKNYPEMDKTGNNDYDKLGEICYHHLKVNQSINFVDTHTGAHTNGIESTWRHAKRFCPEYSR